MFGSQEGVWASVYDNIVVSGHHDGVLDDCKSSLFGPSRESGQLKFRRNFLAEMLFY